MERGERERLNSNRSRVLELLKRKRRVTNVELMHVGGMDAPRRARELRALGYNITVTRQKGGIFIYELLPSVATQGRLWEAGDAGRSAD